ncbi:MAG: hypothetical protein IJE91_00735 [Clostridia bacterium]|nr:hypothetical protein [Clostridia bacterium]
MEERYFFDKRVMKKILIKYGSIFLCLVPILLVVNHFLNQHLKFWLTVLIDITIVLLALLVVELVINHIKRKKEEKENDFVVVKAKEIKAKRNKNSEDK